MPFKAPRPVIAPRPAKHEAPTRAPVALRKPGNVLDFDTHAAPHRRSVTKHPGVPLAFARSALFSVRERTSERLTQHEVAADGERYRLIYTGPQLHQQHSLLWQAIIAQALDRQSTAQHDGSVRLVTSRPALLRLMGKADDSASRRWLLLTLDELRLGTLKLDTPRHVFSHDLLGDYAYDRETGALEISISRQVLGLLADEVAVIDLGRKARLGRNQLALWLHDFISTQTNGSTLPVAVQKLHRLCGSVQGIPQFRQRLRQAADKLSAGEDPVLIRWRIDEDDRFIFDKSTTRVILLPAPVKEVANAISFHEEAIEAAKDQRMRVLL